MKKKKPIKKSVKRKYKAYDDIIDNTFSTFISEPPKKKEFDYRSLTILVALIGITLFGLAYYTKETPPAKPLVPVEHPVELTSTQTPNESTTGNAKIVEPNPDHSGHHLRWIRDKEGNKKYFWRDENNQRHWWPEEK